MLAAEQIEQVNISHSLFHKIPYQLYQNKKTNLTPIFNVFLSKNKTWRATRAIWIFWRRSASETPWITPTLPNMQIYWSDKPPHLLTLTPNNKVPHSMKHRKCLKNLSDTIRPKLELGSPICDSKWTGAKSRLRMRMGQKRKPRSFSKGRFPAWAKTSTLIACGLSMSTFWPKICTWAKD